MSVAFLATGYATTSATLAVANKWALSRFPFSGTLVLAQFAFSAGAVRLLKVLGVVEAEALEWGRARAFFPAVAMFYATIGTNLRLLTRATVDTMIICRAVVPLVTQAGEVIVLGKGLPPTRALIALCLVAIGASGYALNTAAESLVVRRKPADSTLVFWAVAYVACVSVDMLIVKNIVTNVKMTSWGYVYYNNALAMILYPGWMLATGEAFDLAAHIDTRAKVATLLARAQLAVPLTCAIGLAISFFGLNTRRALSATAFTVLGASCKFLSILINALCWRHHAPITAIPWLCIALFGSILYQQASSKKPSSVPQPSSLPSASASNGGREHYMNGSVVDAAATPSSSPDHSPRPHHHHKKRTSV